MKVTIQVCLNPAIEDILTHTSLSRKEIKSKMSGAVKEAAKQLAHHHSFDSFSFSIVDELHKISDKSDTKNKEIYLKIYHKDIEERNVMFAALIEFFTIGIYEMSILVSQGKL